MKLLRIEDDGSVDIVLVPVPNDYDASLALQEAIDFAGFTDDATITGITALDFDFELDEYRPFMG